MNKLYCLETERLLLTPVGSSDAQALHDLWTSPGVRRYLWDDIVVPRSETEAAIRTSEELFVREGFGLWTLRERGSFQDTLIGFAGLWYFRTPPERELLFGIAEQAWGSGLAHEAATAVVRYAFTARGHNRVIASTDAENAQSVRVLEKLGMSPTKRETVDGLDTLFYALAPPGP